MTTKTQSSKARRLSDTQLVILSAAAQRENGAVLPLPTSLSMRGGATSTVLKSLIKRGLITEQPAGAKDEVWRRKEDDEPITLAITPQGAEAIGVEPAEADDGSSSTQPPTRTKRPSTNARRTSKTRGTSTRKDTAADTSEATPQKVTKQALIRGMLERPHGASIDDLQETTGWQPHSIRAVISGLRKTGLKVSRSKNEAGASVYAISTSDQA